MAQEELDNINHKIEKIEDRRKVVLGDYCYVINNKMQRFEKASDDLRRLTENMSQSRENHEKLKAEEQLLKKQCDSAAAQAESAKKTYTEECSRYEILKLAKNIRSSLPENMQSRDRHFLMQIIFHENLEIHRRMLTIRKKFLRM